MRVISGSLKGYKLFAPKNSVRPTSDRVKEALFNTIEVEEGSAVLDLFCGSGALGIEALSRGAGKAIFVDQSQSSINFTKKNIANTHLQEKSVVYKLTVKIFLGKYTNNRFRLIFLDPPYKINPQELKDIFKLFLENAIVDSSTIIVLEHASKNEIVGMQGFELIKTKKYGDTALSFYVLAKD